MRIILLLTVFTLFSCKVSEKQRREICNTCPVKDSVVYKEITVLKDTTIYITQQGPIMYLENPCKTLCDSLGNLKPFEIKKKENGITGTIRSVGNSITFNCKADSLEAIITGLKETIKTSSEVKNIVRYIKCENERTKWDGFTHWAFIILALLNSGYFGFKLLKRKFQ